MDRQTGERCSYIGCAQIIDGHVAEEKDSMSVWSQKYVQCHVHVQITWVRRMGEYNAGLRRGHLGLKLPSTLYHSLSLATLDPCWRAIHLSWAGNNLSWKKQSSRNWSSCCWSSSDSSLYVPPSDVPATRKVIKAREVTKWLRPLAKEKSICWQHCSCFCWGFNLDDLVYVTMCCSQSVDIT